MTTETPATSDTSDRQKLHDELLSQLRDEIAQIIGTHVGKPGALADLTGRVSEQAEELDDLSDEVEEIRAAINRAARRPSPWPHVAVAAIWLSFAAAVAAMAALLPDDAWRTNNANASLPIMAMIAGATIATLRIAR